MMYGRTRTGRLIHITNNGTQALCGPITLTDIRPEIKTSPWDVAWNDPWNPRHACLACKRQHIAQGEENDDD